MPICLYAAGGSLAEPGFGCRDMLRMVRTELHEQPLLLAGDVSSGHSVSSQLLRTDMARTRRGCRRRADAYVAGRTKPTAGLAQLSANPTGHPVVSPTGHQSCRGTTFIRSCEDGERHLEVRVGNVETEAGGRQVFGAVARSDTDIAVLIRRALDAAGRTEDTALTASTDGCPGLRRILADAGIAELPILDWFHIAMRLQHLKQIASTLSTDNPARVVAKAVIVEEVERLRWRIWNGKAKDAQRSMERNRKVMHVFKGEREHRRTGVSSRKLWRALHEVDNYLCSQSIWLVNYAERYRAGLRVGSSITEGTANFLVNRRMNKSQQMRWSRRGADLLLQVRCAVYNGTLGSGLGHRFQPHANQNERSANAA